MFSEKAMESKDKNGLSKEGSSRVGIYRATNLVHCVTVEANYNSGRTVNNRVAPATSDGRVSCICRVSVVYLYIHACSGAGDLGRMGILPVCMYVYMHACMHVCM